MLGDTSQIVSAALLRAQPETVTNCDGTVEEGGSYAGCVSHAPSTFRWRERL